MSKRGLYNIEEPITNTEEGPRKPDLVVKEGSRAIVIDAQVITDSYSLEMVHNNKARKYNTPAIRAELCSRLQVDEVLFTSATLNWIGIWSRNSGDHQAALGIIKKSDLALISTRVLIGIYASFTRFCRTTYTTDPG